jgi:hypothetical protein
MEGYEKKNHGDVKTQETIMMGNFAKYKNPKPHMQNITTMTRMLKKYPQQGNQPPK